jgi:hypothetical protein
MTKSFDIEQLRKWLDEVRHYKSMGHYQGKVSYSLLEPGLLFALEAWEVLKFYAESADNGKTARDLLQKLNEGVPL